ncbi:LLM class flavin-dependent oxidoreductase [Streptomyces sp. AK02-01A]|uniref:LLM class flavin-dependent oxidoreductase n=1 Tax=Streptomyces sp. AK02-01A TaxID=3028648 RepID=UPI0029A67333|nr:LLM class flavin-dependent oxidoreductase [Streptomyces sp. AK02-01A]MDX3850604.1 LLM class flavin-dependent oxidoreductase [Streptomyces sp. AK02-01A]
MHLAARHPGTGTTAVRTGRRSKPGIDFSSFEHLARTAERGKFDFLFLAEALRPHEHQGLIHEPDTAGRPEPITVLSALAAVTDRLGLAATVSAAFNEPYELARRLATLDHLSAGRAAWHAVTSSDSSAGEDVRRGRPEGTGRYIRAAEFVATARELWDSWTPAGPGSPHGAPRPFAHSGAHFDIAGEFTLPRSPQGHPVVIQAGGSEEGREFAASAADVVLTRHGTLEAGRAFYADTKSRLAKYGRTPSDLKIMPRVTVVLGDSDAEAQERAAAIRERRVFPHFVGAPETVAEALDTFVLEDAADGFVLTPPLTPGGLDDFVDRVVPLLQERGAFRTEYTGSTLRSHLGLLSPVPKG